MQHLQPNSTLQSGKYRIERVLGQGGFGRVLIVLLLMIAPVMVMAQASGGQIRRTTNQIVQKQSKKQKGKMQNDNKSVADKYDAMDVRVRLGSYRIVGLDKIVKAKEGDNLVKI
jgi:Na+-transporting methylmalonyl-CoA/oxaloacetate decarboxylase gamma subunit